MKPHINSLVYHLQRLRFVPSENILHNSYKYGPSNEIKIPPSVCYISDDDVVLQTIFDATSRNGPEAGRTYLLVVPPKTHLIPSIMSIQCALVSVSLGDNP